jgi:hypothetical protein
MQPTQKAARLISNVRWTERIYMFGIQNFSVFLVSCILLKITPGQDTKYIVGRSVAQGKKLNMKVALIIFGIIFIGSRYTGFIIDGSRHRESRRIGKYYQ